MKMYLQFYCMYANNFFVRWEKYLFRAHYAINHLIAEHLKN